MGYNSWYDLMGTLTEESIKATADKMVELGLVELGYNYLNLGATPIPLRLNSSGNALVKCGLAVRSCAHAR
eukprot:COSAG01_NODE_7852_length_3025_cov_55.957280_5_plen_71_part_00